MASLIHIPGLLLQEKLHQGRSVQVYRALRMHDGQSVVLKLAFGQAEAERARARLRHERDVLQHLDGCGAVRALGLQGGPDHLVLVLEDLGGVALRQWVGMHSLGLRDILGVARQLAAALGGVHARRVIHNNIHPGHVLVVDRGADVRLIDFGSAATIARARSSFHSPARLEGALPYIAPEQTGRMNRVVDTRADLYSFGVCLYELLTGTVPFDTQEPLALIHAHLAQMPVPPHQRAPGLPEAVSAVVMKLLAKDAGERYQSLAGLQADIDCCIEQLDTDIWISSFEPGTHDAPESLRLPQRLYGRERERAAVLAALQRVCPRPQESQASAGKAELLLVAGESGVGKTSLVCEVHKPLIERRGLFLAGKFEQHQSTAVPYSAFARAFDSICHHLLTESEGALAAWRERLCQSVGSDGRLLIELVPSVEAIIGPQPEPPELDLAARQTRFLRAVHRFLRGMCHPGHPLGLFLDDLQRADAASLRLLESILVDAGASGLLIIGAYRDNEVGRGHPLMRVLNNLRDAGVSVSTLVLGNLTQEQVLELVADALQCGRAGAEELASLVQGKTGGNAFYVRQFLQSLYAAGHLRRVAAATSGGGWTWDMEALRRCSVTENVVDFITSKIEHLPAESSHALTLAACMGTSFDLATLALLAGERGPAGVAAAGASPGAAAAAAPEAQRALAGPQRALLHMLAPAIEQELLIPAGERGSEVLEPSQPGTPEQGQHWLSFQHDRVRQAAYGLIPASERPAVHLALARLLEAKLPAEALEKRLFEVVDHYDRGVELVISESERMRLARMNLQAGIRASAASAWGLGVQYLENGLHLMPAGSWNTDYELTLALHVEMVDGAYLHGDLERMERHAQQCLAHGRALLDVIRVYETRIQAHQAQNRLSEAVHLGLDVLDKLGIELPSNPQDQDLGAAMAALRQLLRDRSPQDIAALPRMTDPRLLAASRIMTSIISVLWNVAPVLYPYAILEFVELSVRHGNCSHTASFYGTYGLVLCAMVEDIDEAYRMAQIATAVAPCFDDKRMQARTCFSIYSFIWHWKHPVREILRPLRDAYSLALESSDLEQAAWCLIFESVAAYCAGQPLPALRAQLEDQCATLERLTQVRVLELCRLLLQSVVLLMEPGGCPWQIRGESYDERETIDHYRADNNLVALALLYCMRLCNGYLFGNYERAIEDAEVLDTCIAGPAATVIPPLANFYDSLTRLALAGEDPQARVRYLERVAQNQQHMHIWAHHAPTNYQHKYDLVAAELARVTGEPWRAVTLYRAAIEAARSHRFIQEEAIANERAACFWEGQGNREYARSHWERARFLYQAWGATAKVAALQRSWADHSPPVLLQSAEMDMESEPNLGLPAYDGSQLDILPIIKAARAISSKLVLAELMDTMLDIVRENAGAQYAALLDVDAGGEWCILCQHGGQPRTPVELPASILHYVRRTRRSLVIADASVQSPYAEDEVVMTRGVRSVMCIPLAHLERWHGLLYLENNLSADAFGEQRQDVTEILVAQAAVSIESAKLYHHLAEQNRALEASRSEIAAAKQQLQDIMDNSPTFIYAKDREGRYLLVNRRCEELFGIARAEFLGKRDAELFPAPTAVRQSGGDQEVLARGCVREFEEDVPHGDTVHTYMSIKFPLRSPDGGIYAVCGISTDISARKRAVRALQRANEELEQRVAERTEQLRAAQHELVDRARHAGMFEVASSILHNLGNALNGITVASGLLHEQAAAMPVELLGRVVSLVARPPGGLVEFFTENPRGRDVPALLETIYQRLEEHQSNLVNQSTSLATQVDHAIRIVDIQQSYANTRITLRELACLRELVEDALRLGAIGGHFDDIIQRDYGDEEPELYERHLLVQILVNLISNAKQAVSEFASDVTPRITITLRQDEHETRVSIADNGNGFDEAVKEKLFMYGFTTRTDGHGFGLHSAAVCAHSLGGRIEAWSGGSGCGASFQLILPRGTAC